MEIDLIPLQSSYMTQNTKDGVKGDWYIQENITKKTLGIMPSNISDKAISDIMGFARKYELEGFNAGIKFQKSKQNTYLKAQLTEREDAIKQLMLENEKLAETLDILSKRTA